MYQTLKACRPGDGFISVENTSEETDAATGGILSRRCF